MARGSFETGGIFIEATVNIDISELSILKAGLIVAGMVIG